jgi:hypothetical protein
MSAAEYSAEQDRKQRASGRGWAILVGVVAVGAAINYWYVSVPVLLAALVVIAIVRSRRITP